MTGKRIGDLETIEMTSGVNHDGVGFVTIRAIGNQAVLIGQLTPAEVRQHALHYLEAAEAAEMDAMVFSELVRTIGVEPTKAAAFIVALRERRESE